ncbi:MAG: dihydrodipicolinate synthase family protein [Acidimicrobiales bacterium]|jgi:4-hydroxy-tetrahydrodipicolinate synthase
MNFEQQRESLRGVVAVPVTPFAPDGGIDEPGYQRIIRRLIDGGVRTVTPNGNTGEFYALSPAEARTVTLVGLEAAGPDATVMVGVGHDVASAGEAARHAQQAGAAMIMVHQPVHPYVSVDGWVEYHRAIAAAVPELGVVLYVRNDAIPGSAFARLAEACPNVIGVKYAVANAARFAAVAADAGAQRFTWVAGLAELHAPGYFALGATGFTSGLANVDPSTSVRYWHALADGTHEVAAQLWHRVRSFEELRAANASADNVSVVKEALCQLGICARDIRPPSSLLPNETRAKVTAILQLWGLLT